MMRRTSPIVRGMIVFCLGWGCLGCLKTDAPLVEADQAIESDNLVGRWVFEMQSGGEVDSVTLEFQPAVGELPKNSLDMVIATNKSDGTTDIDKAWCYVGKIGDSQYLHLWVYGEKNARAARKQFDLEAWKKASDREIVISQLRVADNRLELFVADEAKVTQLLSKSSDVKLDQDDVAKVREKLASGGAQSLFKATQPLVFIRREETK